MEGGRWCSQALGLRQAGWELSLKVKRENSLNTERRMKARREGEGEEGGKSKGEEERKKANKRKKESEGKKERISVIDSLGRAVFSCASLRCSAGMSES